MILVDSSVWIDYFRGTSTPQTDRLDTLLGRQNLAIGDLILTEVLQGIVSDRQFREVEAILSSFAIVELAGKDIAVQASRNYRFLRKRGITIRRAIDAVIATRCIVSGYLLLHSDRDFEPFAIYLGLRVC